MSRYLALGLLLFACDDGGEVRPDAGADAGVDGGDAGAAVDLDVPLNDDDPEWPTGELLPEAFDFPPWLNMPEPNRIVVSWRTAERTTGSVRFGPTPEYGESRESSDSRKLHHVDLGVLHPATAYWYEVAVDGADAVATGVFVTPGRDQWRFVQIAEFHAAGQSDHARSFAPHVRDFRPHLLIDSGDMLDDGDVLENWRSYFRTSAAWLSNVILLPTGSNHVDGPGGSEKFANMFVLPNNERWYTTRYGRVLLFNLDSTWGDILNNTDITTEQPDWIAEQLQQAGSEEGAPSFVIGAWHYPACSTLQAHRNIDRNWVHRNFIETFVESGGIDLVLVGHDKYYERSIIRGEIPHIQTNAGLLKPDKEGNNHHDCETVVTLPETRSLLLGTVTADTIDLSVIDEAGDEIDALVLKN